jgi:hypothetical protein
LHLDNCRVHHSKVSENVFAENSIIRVICLLCFVYCESLSLVSLKINFELICVESNAFSSCSLPKSITIPCYVQILCSGSFSYCEPLSSISFERLRTEAHRIHRI